MSAKVKKNQKSITLKIAGTDFTFDVCRESYNNYLNVSQAPNKVSGFHNFLIATVIPEHEDALVKLIDDTPGSEVAIASAVLEQYTPDLDIVVKK